MLQRILQWMFNNKLLTFLSLLSFCLMISTIALSVERSDAWRELDVCRVELDAAGQTTAPVPETTPAPAPDPETTTEDAETTTTVAPDQEGNADDTEDQAPPEGSRRRRRHAYVH